MIIKKQQNKQIGKLNKQGLFFSINIWDFTVQETMTNGLDQQGGIKLVWNVCFLWLVQES